MTRAALSTLRPGPALAGRTTLGIGGTCLAEAVVRNERDLDALSGFVATERGRPFVLGGGSNLLAAEGELDLIILSVANDEFSLSGTTVRVGAGMKLPVLLRKVQQAGLSGLEGLAGIPGTVGGALAMNAGSWGVEMGDRVVRAALWSPLSGLAWMERGDLSFGYRQFTPDIPGKWLAWSVELSLAKGDPESIKGAMAENMAKKKQASPSARKQQVACSRTPKGTQPVGSWTQQGCAARLWATWNFPVCMPISWSTKARAPLHRPWNSWTWAGRPFWTSLA